MSNGVVIADAGVVGGAHRVINANPAVQEAKRKREDAYRQGIEKVSGGLAEIRAAFVAANDQHDVASAQGVQRDIHLRNCREELDLKTQQVDSLTRDNTYYRQKLVQAEREIDNLKVQVRQAREQYALVGGEYNALQRKLNEITGIVRDLP